MLFDRKNGSQSNKCWSRGGIMGGVSIEDIDSSAIDAVILDRYNDMCDDQKRIFSEYLDFLLAEKKISRVGQAASSQASIE